MEAKQAFQLIIQQRYSEAAVILEEIWNGDHSYLVVLHSLGECYAMMGDPLKVLDRVAQWETQTPGVFRDRMGLHEVAGVLYHMAGLTNHLGNTPAAKIIAEKAQQLSPNDAAIANLIASIDR